MKLDQRPYKIKNAAFEFLCPLCGVERGISVHYKLTRKNLLQVFIISVFLLTISFPWLSWAGLVFLPIVVLTFEFSRRSIYRKEIPCPHCGFDAVWYKRDVPKAKELVQQFWHKENNDISSDSIENSTT